MNKIMKPEDIAYMTDVIYIKSIVKLIAVKAIFIYALLEYVIAIAFILPIQYLLMFSSKRSQNNHFYSSDL